MPIEIKELHIRVAVNTAPAALGVRTPDVDASNSVRNRGGSMDEIVAECVEQVLQVLQNRAER